MRRPPAVARVLERVTATVREHDLLQPGELVLVCVSGGPDSVCLLESLVRLRRLFRVRLEVFHFDHRLRAGSEADAAYVRRLAARLGLPFHLRVAGDAPAGASPSKRGRPSGAGTRPTTSGARSGRRSWPRGTPSTIRPRRSCSTCCAAPGSTASPASGRERGSCRLRDRAAAARRDPRRDRSLLPSARVCGPGTIR